METRATDWFDSIRDHGTSAYRLRPSARVPMRGLGHLTKIFICLITSASLPNINFAQTQLSNWPTGRSLLLVLSLVPLLVVPSLAFDFIRRRAGRDELRIDERSIRSTWRLGPLSRQKTLLRSSVAQLTVVREGDESYALAAENEFGRKWNLGVGYPREMLLALAVEISSRWKELTIDPDFAEIGPGKLAIREESNIPTEIRERPVPPLGSRLICERDRTGEVRITIPRLGLSGFGVSISSLFGVVAMIYLIAEVMPAIRGMCKEGTRSDAINTLVATGAIMLFLLVYLAIAVREALTTRVLIASEGSLTLETKGLLRTSSKSWRTDQIVSIHAETMVDNSGDGSGTTTTSVLVRTTGQAGKAPDTLMSGEAYRTKPDMEFIATTLREALGVPATAAPLYVAPHAVQG
jgi:hypothetical protein